MIILAPSIFDRILDWSMWDLDRLMLELDRLVRNLELALVVAFDEKWNI